MAEPTKGEPNVFLNQLELLTEAAIATTAEAQTLRHDVKKERRKDAVLRALVVLVLFTQLFAQWQTTQFQNQRSEQARAQRDVIEETLNLVRNCVDAERVNSDCQRRGRENTAAAVGVISDNQRDLLILALQCFRDPINVDNQAIEDCILSEGELLRKQREQEQ